METRLGIKAKFMFFIIVVLFSLGLTLAIASITQQRALLASELQKRGLALCKSLASSSVLGILLEDKTNLQKSVDELAKEEDMAFVVIVDAKNQIFAENKKTEVFTQKEILNNVANANGEIVKVLSGRREKFYEFIVPIVTTERKKTIEDESLLMEESNVSSEQTDKKIGNAVVLMSARSIALKVGKMMVTNFILMLIIVGVCIFITLYFLSSTITTPLKNITDVAIIAAEKGDLTQLAKELKTNDEMGSLILAFNKMLGSLGTIVVEVKNASDRVNILAQGLSSSTEQMNASTQEVSFTIQQITKGVTTQAKRTEETTKIIEKMTDSVKQVSFSASEGVRASQENAGLAKDGVANSRQAVDKNNLITSAANEIVTVVGKLGERSQEIGRIVEVITTIADQTNLLALNAAIEAARAGEAGRGFAVVAEEVKRLAESSAQAAEQIGGLVRSIQSETSQAVASVKTASREVEEGSIIIEKVREALDKILKAAEHTAVQVGQIATAADVQLSSVDEVSRAIIEVANIANESASSVERTSSFVEEMTASMEEMSASAQELANMATNLQENVKKFKVKS